MALGYFKSHRFKTAYNMKFYQQIQRAHIYINQRPVINVTASFCL